MRQKVPETYEEKAQQLEELREAAIHSASEQAVEKQHAKGKLTARERVEKLLDPGSFEELDTFVRHRTYEFDMDRNRPWGDAVVTGHGLIDGRPVAVFSQDFTVFGGSLGAYGDVFVRNVQCSGVTPQISLVMGPCAGGAVYPPAMTDFTFMVKETSHMFITGPDVIKTVTGEEPTFEELGGGVTHKTKSGVAHFAADHEEQCLKDVRYLLSFLPSNNLEDPPSYATTDDAERMDEELTHVVPDRAKEPYDMHEVIRRVVDDGEFLEIFPLWAMTVVTGFARLDGHSVGIVANQPKVNAGTLDIDASEKASRFVRFCDAFNIPILTFVDVPGFLPGTQQEFH